MLLTISDIKETFTQLINGKISREEADRWAYKRMQAFDSGSLEFESKSDEKFLWSAIQYLYGIDTMISPGEYMHSIEEIKKTFERMA
jgi:hypothetical protein